MTQNTDATEVILRQLPLRYSHHGLSVCVCVCYRYIRTFVHLGTSFRSQVHNKWYKLFVNLHNTELVVQCVLSKVLTRECHGSVARFVKAVKVYTEYDGVAQIPLPHIWYLRSKSLKSRKPTKMDLIFDRKNTEKSGRDGLDVKSYIDFV